jgi:transposase
MIDSLIAGERDPVVLADLAKKRMGLKIDELRRALVGRFGEHHALTLRLHLSHIDHLDDLLAELDRTIEAKLAPFEAAVTRLQTITGVGATNAQVLLAEIGPDMSVFPSAGHLASWCGICPGNTESAGKQRSGRTNPSDHWLADALVQAAWAASRTKNTWLAARFWRLARRTGTKKALIAVAHFMVIAIWHMQTNECENHHLGTDWWHRRLDPVLEAERLKHRLVLQSHLF